MELTELALITIGGGLGLLAGTVLGGVFGLIFLRGRGDKANPVAIILALGLAAAGGWYGPAHLEPCLGDTLRTVFGEDVADVDEAPALEPEADTETSEIGPVTDETPDAPVDAETPQSDPAEPETPEMPDTELEAEPETGPADEATPEG